MIKKSSADQGFRSAINCVQDEVNHLGYIYIRGSQAGEWLDFVSVFPYFLENRELKSSVEGLGVIASSGYMESRE